MPRNAIRRISMRTGYLRERRHGAAAGANPLKNRTDGHPARRSGGCCRRGGWPISARYRRLSGEQGLMLTHRREPALPMYWFHSDITSYGQKLVTA
jgi:hypothetical protein